MLPVFYQERAITEIQEAFDWYETQQPGLGYRFVDAVDETAEIISAYPFASPVKRRNMREALVAPFPHIMIYKVDAAAIYVLAVFSARKSPEGKYRKR